MHPIRLALVSGQKRDLKNHNLRMKASENARTEQPPKFFIWACEYLSVHHGKV